MTDPLVTIVVPAFRRTEYLPQALAAALAQTRGDFEIIVSDDGPTPEIARIAASFRDPRIRYRSNARNLGIALNHQAAFREARGRFIANLDDDDLWEPTFLEKLVPPLETDAAVNVSFCDHHLIDAHGRLLPELTEASSRRYRRMALAPGRHQPFIEMAVVHQALPMAMAAVFRKSILDNAEFPRRIGGCYDHWLAYLATRDGGAVYYVPERLTRYRIHKGAGSYTRGVQNLRNAIYVRTRFANDPQLARYRRTMKNGVGVYYGKMALLLLAQGERRKARIVEKRAYSLLNRPRNILALLMNAAPLWWHRAGKKSSPAG
jgi:glycosyltransferase involved in cell wall biosynthesis